jgi:predicted transcriptional regulator
MKKDISNNYVVIQGFMIESLGLKSNELFTYALIYGFCQDKDSEFTGSVSYICTWLSCSKNTALKCIKSLIKKGLIKKEVEFKNGLTFNHYTVDFSKINQNCMGGAKTEQGVQKEINRGAKTEQGGGAKTEPNNTINNKDNNIYSDFDFFFSSTDFVESFNDYVKMRKDMKKKLTPRSEKRILNKLVELSNKDVSKAVALLDQSALKNWLDVFPLNNYNADVKPKSTTPTEKRKFRY